MAPDPSAVARGPDDHYFDSAGVRIRYVERGAGDPVVLVHSYAGDLQDQWVKTGVLPELARHYRVVAFDARGHGKSGKPHDPKAYGPEMAWDVVRLLDHLGIAKAHIIGYSMGAHIVAQLLTLAPHRCITATLGGGSGRRNWSDADDRQVQVEADEMERGLLNSQIMRLLPTVESEPTAAQMEEMSSSFLAGKDVVALAAVRRSNKAQAVTADRMAAAQVPVLGIAGSSDPYLSGFHDLRKVMPKLKLVVLDAATHLSAPGKPEFVRAILSFLRIHAVQDQPGNECGLS